MLVVISHAILSTFYITSYQHVYSQTQRSALVVGLSDPAVVDLLEDEGYSVVQSPGVLAALNTYNVVILVGSNDFSVYTQTIREYVEGGGGLVLISGSAESLDLAANHEWVGAQTVGYSGFGENATVSINNPLESALLAGSALKLQSPDQSGALWVSGLESGANLLAQYTSGNVFAYSFESGSGKVYFQADLDAGVGGPVEQANISELLRSGIQWSTALLGSGPDLLPAGTEVTSGNEQPLGSSSIVFSVGGPQSQDLSVPSNPTKSVFVTADAGLVNPILYLDIDGQSYLYHVQIDKGALLTFPSTLNVTGARFGVDDWTSGIGRVGFVTFRSAPSCNLPAGTAASNPTSVPADAAEVGPTGLPGSSVEINSPAVPVTSLLAGFDHDVNGYVLHFESNGVQFQCPIQPELLQLSFDRPIVVSDVSVENSGLWGLVGYIESLGSYTLYAKFDLASGTVLPEGFRVELAPAAPSQTYGVSFSQDSLEVLPLTLPDRPLTALWVSAESGLVDPYVYFRSGNNWYSVDISQANSSLIYFPSATEFDEIYASANGGEAGKIAVGYLYPIALNARAGSDQSVQEEQIVYLDGRSSTGPSGALSFKWTQIEGPTVELQDSNTATAFFSAPEVNDLGARLSFRLVVTDSGGSQSFDIVVVTVKNDKDPNNEPPQIGTIAGASVNEGTQVVLSASAFDPDGDPLKYSWIQKSGPAAVLSGFSSATLSFYAPSVTMDSVLTFEVKVTDGKGHAVTKDVLVTVIDAVQEPVIGKIFAGQDQAVQEGSVVSLSGKYEGGIQDGQVFRWDQIAGVPVDMGSVSGLNTTFVAPEVGETSNLTFRLGLFVSDGTIMSWDDAIVTVNDKAPVAPVGGNVDIKVEGSNNLEVNEPPFTAFKRFDAVPPAQIHLLSVLAPGGVSGPTPAAPVVGIWINATQDMKDLELHFSSLGLKSSINATSDRAIAFVFDRPVELTNITLTSSSSIEQVGIGYYFDQVPLASVSTPAIQTTPVQDKSDLILAKPPEEGAIIKFARENSVIASVMAIGVPVGIGFGLKTASTRRRKARLLNPARALFPKVDPIAGEAEKVRPVIEELEKMLGHNLDTALNASELLDRFGSGRNEASQR